MRTILIPITSNFIVRSFLRADSFGLLAARPDVRLIFLAPQEKCAYYQSQFAAKNAVFMPFPEGAERSRIEGIYKWIETASIHSRTAAMLQFSEFFRRGSQASGIVRLPRFMLKRIFWALGRWRWWREFLRRSYWYLPSRHFTEILEREKPDLVFSATMLPRDMAILKEAKQRGIRTAGAVLSWDNLYSKTALRVRPDLLLAHTPSIREQAARLGDYPRDRTVVTGVPQYDRHFRREGVMPRARFLVSLGGDPKKKLVVYGLSGKMGLDIDFEVIGMLAEDIDRMGLRDTVEVLVRPYPRYDLPEEKLSRIRRDYRFLATASMAHVGTGRDNWEFDEAALSLLGNTLAHADLVITMYSTFFIEAAIFGAPLIAIAFDGETPRDYANSAVRFFEWDHLAEIQPLNGVWRAGSREELTHAVETYLQNPDLHADGRRKIVAQQCAFTDGKAGRRVAEALISLLDK